MSNYEEIKAFVQVVAKIDCVEHALAEIYHMQKENLITENEEEELYQLADPDELVDTPAEEYFNNGGNDMLYNLAIGKLTLVEAMKELVETYGDVQRLVD